MVLKRTNAGFALIDLLVALAVAGLIFASLAALFQALTRAAVRMEAAGGAQAAHVAYARIADMLEGALMMSHTPLGCTGLTGDAGSARWVTAAAPLSAGLGPVLVRLSADPSAGGSLWLEIAPVPTFADAAARAPAAQVPPAPVSVQLVSGVGAAAFAYRAPARGTVGTLLPAWSEACTPPAAVELTLTPAEGGAPLTFSFPLRVDRAANLR